MRTVVFDIDGTLTPGPLDFTAVREHASGAARIYADAGWDVLYLSARPSFIVLVTELWLRARAFPRGHLIEASTVVAVEHPDLFKASVLADLKLGGCEFTHAYGDLPTDFAAYGRVGIPHVFALRHEGSAACEPGTYEACLTGWSEHLDWIRANV